MTLTAGRTVIKTKIKSVMIVTKARDHGLVQLTRELAEWLMTCPRHGKTYGIRVHVEAKLEKSKRFDADGLYKDHPVIGERNLLQYWTPETCVFADTFDIVITVSPFLFFMLIEAWWRRHSPLHVMAIPADRPARHVIQPGISWILNQLQIREYAGRSQPLSQRRIPSKHANALHLHRLPLHKAKHRSPRIGTIRRISHL